MAVNIYTMGDAGHGKTTLTAAIMYCLGISYPNLQTGSVSGADSNGVAHETYATPARQYAHTDAPLSQRDAILAGGQQMDIALLVVSAVEGPMSGARRSLESARQVGVSKLVVFLNKSDVVDDIELCELIEMEIRELVSFQKFPGDDVPVVTGSATAALASAGTAGDPNAAPIFALVAALDETAAA